MPVAIEDIDSFDAELSEKVRKAPADFLPLFESAAAEVLAGLKSKIAGETGEMEEPSTGEVQVLLSSKENSISIRSLGADFISKLVKDIRMPVAIEDIDSFDAELSEKVRKAPADFLPLFESAAAEVLAGLKSKIAGETGEMEEPSTGEVQVLLSSKENSISIRSLGADFISKLVKISGCQSP